MTVVSAAVESDGWTLRVTYAAAAPATRADFALFSVAGTENQTEANARVVATVSGPGFNRVGAEAVGATRNRTIVAHEVRYGRYPDWEAGQSTSLQPGSFTTVPPLQPGNRPLGEVDNGGGSRTIRLMLHKPVAPGETVSVTFQAGWKAGATGPQTISATNNSTTALEIPSFRWITVPYEALRGTPSEPVNSTIVDMLASHVMPEGKSGVAGIRIIATDGTNKSVPTWLSIGTSTKYGDSVRCWTGNVSLEVDGSPGTYLNSGLISLHATVYPWFGVPRHSFASDPATTAASVLQPAGNNYGQISVEIEAERPLVLAYDRTGTRYGYTTQANPGGGVNPLGHAPSTYYRYACVVVDPAGGLTTDAAASSRDVAERTVGLGNTPEEARTNALLVTTANRCGNIPTAVSMFTRLARALDNANGFVATKTASNDGFEVYLIAGAHTWSSNNGLTGATTTETYMTLNGAGSASTSILGVTSGSNSYGRATRVRWSDFTFRARTIGIATGGSSLIVWFDQGTVLIDDNPGTPLSAFGTNAPAANSMRTFATNMVEDFVTAGWNNSTAAALMVRSISSRKGFASPTVVNCLKTGAATTSLALAAPGIPAGSTEASWHDVHWWNNDLRHVHTTSGWAFTPVFYTAAGDGRQKFVRQNVINNIMEKSGGTSAAAWAIGEGNTPECDVRGLIIEHNTVVGDRANHCYNDPAPVDLAGTFSRFNSYSQCRIANNYFDRMASKHDAFSDGSVSTLRAGLGEPAATRGYRGHLTQGWQIYFGHLNEGNVDGWLFEAGTTSGADPNNRGLRCIITPFPAITTQTADCRAWPAFNAPASRYYGGAGRGDYRPASGSPLLGRATSAQIDTDQAGRLRSGASWTAGALDAEPATPPATALDPARARHAHVAGSSALGVGVALLVSSTRLALRGLDALLGFVPGAGPATGGARTRRVPRDDRRASPARD